jgi:hypothetical protein
MAICSNCLSPSNRFYSYDLGRGKAEISVMPYLRFMCHGRVEKPLPVAFTNALPAIKTMVADLQTYAKKVGNESTVKADWGNEVDHAWFVLDLAIPMPIPAALQTKLPTIRNKIRELEQYSTKSEKFDFRAQYHICNHDIGEPCIDVHEI